MSATEVEYSQADNPSPLLSMTSPPSCELEQRRQLLAVGKVILEQAVDLVERKLASDDQLLINAKHLPGSTIGKHLRHARDHFEALLDSTNLHPKPLALDYDARKRDIPMESSLKAASEALRGTIDKMEAIILKTSIHSPITLHAITPYEQSVTTTFGREMWFCELHAVHHWAVVRVICGELGITLEDSFGFAPSTMVHQGSISGSGLEKAKI